MDTRNDLAGDSPGASLGETAVMFIIVVCMALVCVELVIQALSEMDRRSARKDPAAFVMKPSEDAERMDVP